MVDGGGTTSTTVYVGTPGDTQVVVVNGDFWLKDHGAGILVVTGELTFNGNIDFDGMILVIGKGSMVRNGAGKRHHKRRGSWWPTPQALTGCQEPGMTCWDRLLFLATGEETAVFPIVPRPWNRP